MDSKVIVILFSLLFTVMLASTDALASENAECNLSAAGMSSQDKLNDFIAAARTAAAIGTPGAFEKLILYPLVMNRESKFEPFSIKNEKQFENKFSSIFTPKLLTAIQTQKMKNVFCNGRGVLIGSGHFWVREVHGRVGIVAIDQ